MKNKIDNDEYEKLSSIEDLEIIPTHKLLINKKLKRTKTHKRYISINDISILFGIVFIYILLFMTRYYILSPIEIDKSYKNINPHDRKIIYIPIVGTNDIHGHFFPVINKIKLNSTKIITYKTGGVELIYSYINILKEEFGADRVLYFDAGDHYFGAQDSKIFEGKNFDDFFNYIGLNGTTLGNNDYNYPREWIENKIKNANYPFLINNIKDKNFKQQNGILGENQDTSYMYEIKLSNHEIIKIGVIGLTINKREDKTFYDIGNKYTWDNLFFERYEKGLKREAEKLRENGANAVLILCSLGLNCTNEKETSILNMYNKTSSQTECDSNSVLYKLLNNTDPDLIDGIIAGDSKNDVHQWVNDIPIMSTRDKARSINIMYLPFKRLKKNQYTLIKENIKIEGPLPLCEKVFHRLKHCETISKEEYSKAGKLVEYYWHSRRIELEPVFETEFDEYYIEYQRYVEDIIVKFIGFENKLKVDNSGDSLLGNLFLDAMRNISQSDFSIANTAMFKNEILPGYLSHIDIMNMIHENEKLCITEVTGEELITIIKNVQTGEHAYQATSGLRQTITIYNNGIKNVTDIKLYTNDGNVVPINKNKTYIMSSNNYILSEESGEDFRTQEVLDIIQDKFKNNQIKCDQNELGMLLVNYFQDKEINITEEVNITRPRIIIKKEVDE